MEYIQILGPNHLLYIAVLIFFTCLLFMNQSYVRDHRNTISKYIVTISILQQILLYGSYVLLGEFTLQESLPFHISRINTILGIIFLFTKSEKLFSFVAYFSVFAWLSFLVPSNIEPITHPRGVSFLTNHVITLLLPFYGMIAYNYNVQASARKSVIQWFLVYFVFVALFNPIVNGNYFYLRDKPIFSSVPNIFYYPGSILVSILLFFIIEQVFRLVQSKFIHKQTEERVLL